MISGILYFENPPLKIALDIDANNPRIYVTKWEFMRKTMDIDINLGNLSYFTNLNSSAIWG